LDIKLYDDLANAARDLEKANAECFFQQGNSLYFGDPRKLHEPGSHCKMLFHSSVVNAVGSVQRLLNYLTQGLEQHRQMNIKMARTQFDEALDKMRKGT